MPAVLPFRALRYTTSAAASIERVLCPPYDVISPDQQRALQGQSPHNAVHLELPEGAADGMDNRYQRAAQRLVEWQRQGVLQRDAQPAYYLHETQFNVDGQSMTRRDMIAAVRVEPWSAGAILPHERTMAGPKADRLALLRATGANLSPIWVLHREQPGAVAAAWDTAHKEQPTTLFTYQGEQHRLWALQDPAQVEAIRSAFSGGGPLYIADGHHRYETALAFSNEASSRLPGASAALATVTWAGDPGMLVLPTHRMLRQAPQGVNIDALRAEWARAFEVSPLDSPADDFEAQITRRLEAASATPAFVVLGPGSQSLTFVRLRAAADAQRLLPADRSSAWRSLDLAVLHSLILDPLVEGVNLERDENLSYTRNAREAIDAVHTGQAAMAFFTNPTRVDQVLDVADARDRMPEKSTYFQPKPPTGLVIRVLDEA